jgi:hypothetical protein
MLNCFDQNGQQQIELLSPEARSMEQLVPRAGDEIVERVRCARSVPGVWTAKTSNRNFLADDRRKICPYQLPYTPLHNLVPLGNWRVHLMTLLDALRLQVTTFVTSAARLLLLTELLAWSMLCGEARLGWRSVSPIDLWSNDRGLTSGGVETHHFLFANCRQRLFLRGHKRFLHILRGALNQVPAAIQTELVFDVFTMALDRFHAQIQRMSDLSCAESRA